MLSPTAGTLASFDVTGKYDQVSGYELRTGLISAQHNSQGQYRESYTVYIWLSIIGPES